MSDKPMVSISMPTYNQEHLIVEAIESVINQTYTDWELVIGDDCSTDNTYEVALGYQQRFPEKIILFRNEVNLGITGNCNEVLKRCRGKYIAFTAGDDVFYPEKLSVQIELMESNIKAILCHHPVDRIDGESRKLRENKKRKNCKFQESTKNAAKELIEDKGCYFSSPSIVVRLDAVRNISYETRINRASDFLFWVDILLASNGKVLCVDKVLAAYRMHESSTTSVGDFYGGDPFISHGIIEYKYPMLIDSVRIARGSYYYQLGVMTILKGNLKIGRLLLFVGAKYSIFSIKFFGWILFSYYRQFMRIFH